MNVYTDPALLDVAGAMESLPSLPLSTGTQEGQIAISANGSDELPQSFLVPELVPATVKSCLLKAIADRIPTNEDCKKSTYPIAVSAYAVNEKSPLTSAVNRLLLVDRRRVELPTSALRTQVPKL